MTTTELAPPAGAWTAAELRRLPPDQRDAALAAAAERAAADYRRDPALTAFEAFEAFGPETRKVRATLVVSLDWIGRLPLRLVVPVTDWKPHYVAYPWFTFLPVDSASGLSKDSGADAFQTKSVSLSRFVRPLGAVTPAHLDSVASAIALCVGAP